MTKEYFKAKHPEIYELWLNCPIALNIADEWIQFAEYVRAKTTARKPVRKTNKRKPAKKKVRKPVESESRDGIGGY